MKTDNTTSLIVVLKGSKNVEEDGRIIRFGSKADMHIIQKQIAEKLSILGGLDDILLFNEKNKQLTTIEQIKEQQVVYVDMKQHITSVVPGPSGLPFVGALYELLPDLAEGWLKQFNKYGPLVKLSLLGREVLGTNSPEYAEIFVKESEYFSKKIMKTGLMEVKPFGGQGLFTTDTDEMDWKLAHKLLMPAFSPRAIKVYQKEMGIITQQAIKVLEQFQPEERVEILEWTTNITFETIGRVGFGYEFNLLSDRNQPPNEFIEAMGFCLTQAIQRIVQAQFMKKLPLEANRKFDRCVELMHNVVDGVVAERKNGPEADNMDKDLLGYMLNARDEHNLGLSDENIRDQVVTFLIAGHDTTANTIAWCLYQLSKNPDVQERVLQEIADNHITWQEHPTSEQISNLKYMHQVIKEILRLYAPVRALGKRCIADCILPGGYALKAGNAVTIQLHALHYNPEIYPDPYKFDPDRWTPEQEQKRSRFAWLPFSTGPRGCIGMAFALQEAKTVLAMLLNRFDFRYDGPDVKIHPKMATTKPVDLLMTIHPRENFPEPSTEKPKEKPATSKPITAPPVVTPTAVLNDDVELPPITFLFGTQTGTAQDYANQLAKQAKNFGFKTVTLCDMDRWKVLQDGKFTTKDTSNRTDKELVVICTATYNGQPPDSADKFNKFLDFKVNEEGHEQLLKGLSFAVFGLGNRNWRTYQHFPIKVANCFEDLGATRFFASGEGDADGDMDAEFNEWCAHFWTYTLDYYHIGTASESNSVVPSAVSNQPTPVKVTFIPPTNKEAWSEGASNHNGESNAVVLVNRELQTESSPRSTRHVEIDISKLTPVGDTYLYQAGDHFVVWPENNNVDVDSIALGFGWVLDSVFQVDQDTISDVSPRSLAANIKGACSVRNMLKYYADLTSPPSRSMLGFFAAQLELVSPETAATFTQLLMPDTNNQDQYPAFIAKYRTLLDLQQAFPQVNRLELGQFLASVPVIQPRRYSIASSPIKYPTSIHLAVGVVDDNVNEKHYPGLASSFLKRVSPGTKLRACLKSSKNTFSLPKDPSVPIIMIAAGTGLAPFRGFLQERQVDNSVLFFGCRRPDQDYIYKEELETLTHKFIAFSRTGSPVKYVQHQLLTQASYVWNLLFPTDPNEKPASVYVCGSGAMSNDVRQTFCNMAISFGVASNEQEAEQVVDDLMNENRYMCDVWG